MRNNASSTIKKYVLASSLLLDLFIIFMDILPTSLFDDEESEYAVISDKMNSSPLHSQLSVVRRLNKAAHVVEVSGEIP